MLPIQSKRQMSDIEGKSITSSDCSKFASDILDAKIKKKELVNKSNISSLVNNFEVNTKLAMLIMLLVGNQNRHPVLFFFHYVLMEIKWE